MAIHAKLRGAAFGILLFISTTFGVLLCGVLTLPVLAVSSAWHRQLFDYCMGSWTCYCVALLELLLGIRPVIYGDEVRPNEPNLLLMNHRTRLDWLFLWQVLIRQSGIMSEKIILKGPLKQLPGVGWAMQVGAMIFLERKWEHDKEILTSMMDYFRTVRHKTQVLLFPEGTNMSTRSKERSNAFAEKNNMAPFEYVLHPRTTGFTFLTQHMRNNNQIEAVYDITVGYPPKFPETELQLLLGNIPDEVHFHVRRYNISELPANEEGLQEWCRQRWQEKEVLLDQFYKNYSFPKPDQSPPTKVAYNPYKLLVGTIALWTVFMIAFSIMLWQSALLRWICLIQAVFYVAMGQRGGFEMFLARVCLNRLHNKQD